ncbi:serine/threonine-protein kinase [Glycomyces salinus]|uniref:serine/threonine-protein kinase n=1 Tax=Glycomyces salinus TaxID=980294 RepID=UPI0018EC8ED4|nr:serine/threonine-protein kinase [Glycomyces salinus]
MPPATVPTIPGYRDLTAVAGGSTAVVYRAVQERLDRVVAVKVLVDGEMNTTDSMAKELETTVLVSGHPHIVSIIDTGSTGDGRPYIVMEYCEGGSYSSILKDRGPLGVEQVVEVGVKIGQALQAAHEAGIIHRDVKPQNILRGQYGPALADFGIARAPEALSATQAIDMLTPLHASPEALLRRAQSPASDLYSLASSMWHLLAGHAPFADPEGGTDPDAHRRRVTSAVPPPALPREDVPEWLERLLVRSLDRDPARRPESCRAFAESLQMADVSDRMEAKEAAERTVVLPSENGAAAPPAPDRAASGPPFESTPADRAAPFTPPAPPGPAHRSRFRTRRVGPGLYPVLTALVVTVVMVLGGVGIVWAVASGVDRDEPASQSSAAPDDGHGTETGRPTDAAAEEIEISLVDPSYSSFTVYTSAEPDTLRCTATVKETDVEAAGDCNELTVDGLRAGVPYVFVLEVEGSDQAPLTEWVSTTPVLGKVRFECPSPLEHCGSGGARVDVGADPDRNESIGDAYSGDQYYLYCYTETDRRIDPRGEEGGVSWDSHPGKAASNLVVEFDHHGQVGYLPFVWFELDPDDPDSTGPLAEC